MKITRSANDHFNPSFPQFTRASFLAVARKVNLARSSNVKVAADLVMSVVLLVILAPVMISIAALVALDGGPVLYRHLRIGKGGHRFYCLKFRSMVLDADKALADRLGEDPSAREEWAITPKLRYYPRVTAVGLFLRATSLDELPQLFNVLKLDMSLVGRRPIVENELPRYGRHVSY